MSWYNPDTNEIQYVRCSGIAGCTKQELEEIAKEKAEKEKKENNAKTKVIVISLAIAASLFFIFKKKRK
jgi:hypothetical protein